ncbi:hypothetical protein [Robiginitalea sp. SC105]|uniref:hypothetical protein n=1 Tax=Robiginitalea sp. SC105 TaxID=2762332 RepID=UPI00163B172D|nr:hypothetical protein [Robiginitalea sp. SC105]MBC2838738.1 hypothetical protein [Robiginitalea sp. SC105]
MKILKSILLLSAILLGACSNDNGGGGDVPIEGTWDAVALETDPATATEDELLAADFLDILTARDCYILSVTFGADGSAVSENSFDYLDLSGLATGDFNIPCPTQSDSETGIYTYEDGVLSFTDPMGVTSSVNASISGNRLYMDLENSVFQDVVSTGRLVFEKR